MARPATYDSAPMSATLYDPCDLKELAVTGAEFDEALSLAKLPRLVEALAVPQPASSQVACKVKLDRDAAGRARLTGTLNATLEAQCQRCLEPVSQRVDTALDWCLDGGEDAPGDRESIDVGGRRVRIVDLLEDELLLRLPQVARHTHDEECGPLAARLGEAEAPASNRPFAALGDLKAKLRGEDS